jgi:hypothetical protein
MRLQLVAAVLFTVVCAGLLMLASLHASNRINQPSKSPHAARHQSR